MTNTLSWTRKNEWGTVGNTYRAESNGWKYCVDSPRKGEWVLRGWGPGDAFMYRNTFRTLREAKAEAQTHADTPPVVLAVDEGAQVLMAPARSGMRASGFPVTFTDMLRNAEGTRGLRGVSLGDCSCPTPTHRMSCGAGSRPRVVRRAA